MKLYHDRFSAKPRVPYHIEIYLRKENDIPVRHCQTHSALALPRAVCFVEGLGIRFFYSSSLSQSQLLGQEVRFELLLSV